jgi:hypothetical protein
MLRNFDTLDFIRESNRIEGILHEPTSDEIAAYVHLQTCDKLRVADIEKFVDLTTRGGGYGAILRRKPGMDVTIGGYSPPPGGPRIEMQLGMLLGDMNMHHFCHMSLLYEDHIRYEQLHPFSDGNGRSGRAIWWWMNGCDAPIGFLHQFYYSTLRDKQ